MKKVAELNKLEKVMLLKSIAAGEVDRSTLTHETLIAIEPSDWFLSMMMRSDNPDLQVVLIGDAALAEKNAFLIELENQHGEVLQTVRTTR